jgi:hypothetical protein
MGSVLTTVKTRIIREDVKTFTAFLEEKGVVNFSVFVPKDSVFVYVQFLKGGEMMKYRLRGLEDEFIANHGLSYEFNFENAWQDVVQAITGEEDED